MKLINLLIGISQIISLISKPAGIPAPPQTSAAIGNPANSIPHWQLISSGDKLVKLIKTDTGLAITPTITLNHYLINPQNLSPDYLDSLISGAFSSLPSLQVHRDSRQINDGWITRIIYGTYSNSGYPVYVRQALYLTSTDFYVLTASYPTADLEPEIDRVSNQLFDEYLQDKLK
jgi:hypothetical protein